MLKKREKWFNYYQVSCLNNTSINLFIGDSSDNPNSEKKCSFQTTEVKLWMRMLDKPWKKMKSLSINPVKEYAKKFEAIELYELANLL